MSSRKLALVCGLLLAGVAAANDGVAQFGAGGIVLFGREPRVAMVRERLTISLSRIAVEYEFLNESREELVTEVAFPIPPYGIEQATRWADAPPDESQAFDVGFAGTADGKPIQPERQVRALVGDLDVTLATANTWKTPIRDFELVVERAPTVAVSFCWDGKVVRDGKSRLRARKKDFRPEREVTIYFIPTGHVPGCGCHRWK